MFEGLLLGLMTFISMVISFLKLPEKAQQFLLKNKVLTDLGAAGICFLLISGISKSIAALFASIFCGLLVGISLEVAEMATDDPAIKEKLQSVKANTYGLIKTKLKDTILNINVPGGEDAPATCK